MKHVAKTFIISLLTLMVLAFNLQAAELKQLEKPVTPPPLKLESLKGDTIDLKDYQGKVVLVQFWATYCTPCRLEMPSMNKLMKKLEEQKIPFVILAVNMGETKDEINKFVNVVKPDFTILLDPNGENVQAWNVFAAPSNFLIGPDGKIHATLYGGVDWDSEEIVKAIQDLAKKDNS